MSKVTSKTKKPKPRKFPTLLLAKRHFDPSGDGYTGRCKIETDSTPYYEPNPGDLALVVDDGGAVVVRLGRRVALEGAWQYWDFARIEDTEVSQGVPIKDLSPCYKPIEPQPTLL